MRKTTIWALWAASLLPLCLPAAPERIIRPDGDVDLIETQAGLLFTTFRRELRNAGPNDREVRVIEFVRPVSLAGTARDYRTLGVDGLKGAESAASSYLFLAVARPDASDGTVAGWITQERGSGSVHSKTTDRELTITGRLEFGRLRIKPGQSVITDAFVLGSFTDARLGLETYADTIAKVNQIKLPKIPNGYCTWYSSPHGGASDEKAMAELAAFCGKELTKFGFDTILVDDQWQGPAIKKGGIMGTGPTGNFTRHDPRGPYPSGMKANADKLLDNGIRPGLWFTPFSWDPRDPLFRDHQDWFVKKENSSLYEVLWAGWCLDMTHPQARAFLADSVRRITQEWGYGYLKPDAMWCGLAAKCTYPGTAYVDEKFGDAVFHDPYMTGIEAYRAGIRTMRAAAGPGTYIAACNVAQNFRSLGGAIGLVDAMRIGPDTGADWGAIMPNFHLGTRLYFLHNRVWHNDPDCLMVRAPLTLTQARSFASWIALSGSLNLVSEWLPGLPADRLDCIKRSMPNTGLAARPLDLFENMPARAWHLTDGRRHVAGLFNWSATKPATASVKLDQLGLRTEGPRFIGLDYWSGGLVPIRDGVLSAGLPPSGCGIIAIARILDRPQLLGTSRHITQCFVDGGEDQWNNARLSGACKLVGGDATELRILTASTQGTWKGLAAEVSPADREAGVTISLQEHSGLLRVPLASPTNREVQWTVRFDPQPVSTAAPVPVDDLKAGQAAADSPVVLSWTSANPFHEVKRNGTLVASAAARGFTDTTPPAGESCTYTVTPFNLDDRRGESRTVTITPRAFILGPLPPAPEVSLVALKPRQARMGWGQFHTGKSIAGLPLTLGKQVYADGIGTHAAGEVVYDRKPEWKRFVAVLGIDETQRRQNQSSLAGKVVAENAAGTQTILASSAILRFGQRETWHFDLVLPADCVRLRLVIEDGGDGDKSDHADWVNAGFRREQSISIK